MKKIIYSLSMLAIAALTFTSCEDVPMPYDEPGNSSGDGGGDVVGEVEPSGTGTEADPFNCVAATNYTSQLAADVESEEDIYIKGKIVSIEEEYTSQYGNASFTISEDGTASNTFKIWRAYYLGNKKFADGQTQVNVGDEVVVCGKVVNYKGNTPETVQGKAYLYSLNGVKGEGGSTGEDSEGEAKGDGTETNPFNSVAANNYASSLASGAESDKDIYIKGKVVSVKEQYGTQYGNATFYISDDGTASGQFYVFRALYLGNVKYTSGDLLKEGDDVVVCGRVTNYMGNTPETVQGKAYLYSLNGKTVAGEGSGDEGGEVTPAGDNILANGDFELWNGSTPVNWKSASTASSATLSQRSDAHGGSYSVGVGFAESSNKRIAYKEITLKAGTYKFAFYAKSTTADPSQCRPGYVPVKSGSVGSYSYGDYASIKNSSWTLVEHEFSLSETTTVCLVVMNPKTSSYATAQEILIDDASLTTKDGGLVE